MKKILIILGFLFVYFISNAGTKVIVFTKDGNTIILNNESKNETNILLSKNFINNGQKIELSNIDSIVVGNSVFTPILYKESLMMARLLFKGETEGYKIHYNGEKQILIKEKSKGDYIKVSKENKIGVYNYLFPNCTKKDSNLLKVKSSVNDLNITNEITKKFNCNKYNYIIYIKRAKIDIYLGGLAGVNLYFPTLKADGLVRFFNSDKVKPSIGYSAGGRAGILINDKIEFNFSIQFVNASAKFTSDVTTRFYSYTDTVKYTGKYYNKSVDIDFNLKYLFLRSKLTPTVFGGFYYSHKLSNNVEFQHDNILGTTDLSSSAVGLNLGVGLYYRPIKRLNFFLDVGCKIGGGLFGPSNYKIGETYFYSTAGVCIKLNK